MSTIGIRQEIIEMFDEIEEIYMTKKVFHKGETLSLESINKWQNLRCLTVRNLTLTDLKNIADSNLKLEKFGFELHSSSITYSNYYYELPPYDLRIQSALNYFFEKKGHDLKSLDCKLENCRTSLALLSELLVIA